MNNERAIPPLPRPNAEDVHFAAPWEASVFAITVGLSESGQFTWDEWVQEFAGCLASHPDEPYYQIWLEALENTLGARDLLGQEELADRHQHLIQNPPPHDHVARREPIATA